jgi:hypothetical protein
MKGTKISHLDEKYSKKQEPSLDKDVFTSRKHSMDYFTADGVMLRTGYKSKRDWYLLPIREMLDNDIDFLWKYYKGAEDACIVVNVSMDNDLFRLGIQNSNYKNIPVFSDLKSIFDYDMRYGSKQDLHIISRGMLGDAMKQILSLGYVLLHTSDDGTAFTNKQWEYPLIIRHNKREWKIYLYIDKALQAPQVKFMESKEELAHTNTELELVLPITDEVRNSLDRDYIEQFCRKYSVFTTDISFKFRILDEISHNTELEIRRSESVSDEIDITSEFTEAISTVPVKGILNIDIPALHPISLEWSNTNSIHSYKPEEFISRLINVHDKNATTVYDIMITYREGTHIKKTDENRISLAKFLSGLDKDKRIERLYHQLKDIDNPAQELSLPYTSVTKKRSRIIAERIGKLYDIDNEKEPSYKLVRGFYNNGVVKYPFAFEITAIPLNNPSEKSTEIITAVNYSVSPRENTFEGDYEWDDKNGRIHWARNINELLQKHGFHGYNGPKSRLPSIIVANLVTSRRDPQGYDKSSIDTQPFTETIAIAVDRMASGIQTFRAAGYVFQEADDYRTARRHETNRKVSCRELLKQFLMRERGLSKKVKIKNE